MPRSQTDNLLTNACLAAAAAMVIALVLRLTWHVAEYGIMTNDETTISSNPQLNSECEFVFTRKEDINECFVRGSLRTIRQHEDELAKRLDEQQARESKRYDSR